MVPDCAVQDMKDNVTRFVVLSRDPLIDSDALTSAVPYKTSIVFSLQEVRGVEWNRLWGGSYRRQVHVKISKQSSISVTSTVILPSSTPPGPPLVISVPPCPVAAAAGPGHAVQGAERVCAARHRHDQDRVAAHACQPAHTVGCALWGRGVGRW